MSRRLCFVLDLADDAALIAEYEAWHRPGGVWPQVLADIRAQGFEEMEIWRSGPRLVMVATVSDDFPRPRSIPPEHDAWEDLMWRFQKALPHAAPGEKWMKMAKIFDLGEHRA